VRAKNPIVCKPSQRATDAQTDGPDRMTLETIEAAERGNTEDQLAYRDLEIGLDCECDGQNVAWLVQDSVELVRPVLDCLLFISMKVLALSLTVARPPRLRPLSKIASLFGCHRTSHGRKCVNFRRHVTAIEQTVHVSEQLETGISPDNPLTESPPFTNTAPPNADALDPPFTRTAPPSRLERLPLPTMTSPDGPSAVEPD
jgi:hypothetical protein